MLSEDLGDRFLIQSLEAVKGSGLDAKGSQGVEGGDGKSLDLVVLEVLSNARGRGRSAAGQDRKEQEKREEMDVERLGAQRSNLSGVMTARDIGKLPRAAKGDPMIPMGAGRE